MIKKLWPVLIFFLFPALTASAQIIETNISYTMGISGNDSRLIVHTPNQKLVIEDFKGEPDESRNAVAITSSGFLFKAGFKSKGGRATLDILVDCSFDKQQSWMKEKGKNEYVLSHEQHHFDISYINALLFIKKLKMARFTDDNYKELLQEIYNKSIEAMEQLQQKYDAETNNGTLKDKQQEWNKKIDAQLVSLIGE